MRQGLRSKCVGASALCVLALTGRAHAQQFTTQLHAPDATAWRWLGTSLAMDATTFVSGAPESIRNQDISNCSTALPGYGAIAIYKKTGSTWNYAQKFWSDTTANFNEIKFGNSISLRGNTLVVSAEREDFSSSIANAGAFLVYTRPSASANFSKLGTFFSPNPSAGARLGETSGLASNTQFIAIGDPASQGAALVYKIQNNTVTFAYSVPLPVNARFSSLFITDNNVLVGTLLGWPSLLVYALGPSGYSAINPASITVPNAVATSTMSGDGNTVAAVLRDTTTAGSYFTQVVNFSSNGVNWVDTRPVERGLVASFDDTSPQHIAMKESSGFFLSFNDASTPFLASYKFTFNGGSGHDYNYQGVFLPQNYPALSAIGLRATAVGFNGTDLLLGDPDLDAAGSSGACNFASNGGIDIFSMDPVTAPGPSSSTRLQPWITTHNPNNGFNVATTSGFALAGQGNASDELSVMGQATLYRLVGSTWEQLEKYVDGLAGTGTTAFNSEFGTALAINWHALFIGADNGGPRDLAQNLFGTGVVYEADAFNGAYQHGPLTRTLPLPPDVGPGAQFGSALALDNDTLLVGAVSGGPPPKEAGATYVYAFDNSTQRWGFKQGLQPPAADLQFSMAFGAQVGISGDYAVVSAPFFSNNGVSQAGAVYVYQRVNGMFSLVQRLMAPQPSSFDDFGQTLAIANAGNYIAVAGISSGVRLFRLNGTTFVPDGAVPLNGPQFASLALSNVGLLVGTPSDAHVRRFTRFGANNWALGGTLSGPMNQGFANSVALQDSNVLIGAPLTPSGVFVPGAAYATTFNNVR